MNKIAVIENSLRCFTCGLLGLIPLFGVGFSFAAFIYFSRATRLAAGEWNPARGHARFGHLCAVMGLLFNSAAWCGVFLWACHQWQEGW